MERQAKMRARAKELREKREQERLAIVQEKLDIRWRFVFTEETIHNWFVLECWGVTQMTSLFYGGGSLEKVIQIVNFKNGH